MSALQVIVGAGPIGTALATRLARDEHRVRVLTRSGRDLGIPGVESVAVDASDEAALTAQVTGAAVLYNCANPSSYPLWEKRWPPLAAAITRRCRTHRCDAGDGEQSVRIRPGGRADDPRQTPLRPSDHKGELRARMWREALAAHEAGRVRVAEARSSDYIGPTLPISSGLLARYADATLAGKTATVFADPDQPHSWTAIDDVAATLAALGRDERAWGFGVDRALEPARDSARDAAGAG